MLKTVRNHWHLMLLWCVIMGVIIFIGASGRELTQTLRYDAIAMTEQQEYWRLLTAHFAHLGWSHLWLNAAGLTLIFLFFAPYLRLQYWAFSILISAIAISVLIYFFNPEIRWYVGLSGVLHTLFIIGGIANISIRKWEGLSFTVIILAKVFYEQITGPLPGSEQAAGGPVLVDAHFYGAMIGLVLAIPLLLKLAEKKK